jgi:hypothetical protein
MVSTRYCACRKGNKRSIVNVVLIQIEMFLGGSMRTLYWARRFGQLYTGPGQQSQTTKEQLPSEKINDTPQRMTLFEAIGLWEIHNQKLLAFDIDRPRFTPLVGGTMLTRNWPGFLKAAFAGVERTA